MLHNLFSQQCYIPYTDFIKELKLFSSPSSPLPVVTFLSSLSPMIKRDGKSGRVTNLSFIINEFIHSSQFLVVYEQVTVEQTRAFSFMG